MALPKEGKLDIFLGTEYSIRWRLLRRRLPSLHAPRTSQEEVVFGIPFFDNDINQIIWADFNQIIWADLIPTRYYNMFLLSYWHNDFATGSNI